MGWEAVVDQSTGKTYYFDSTTNETSWVPPPGFGGTPALPAGWEAVVDPSSGNTYYFHAATNETSWTLPEVEDVDATATVVLNDDGGGGGSRAVRRNSNRGVSRDRSPSNSVARGLRRGASPGRSLSRTISRTTSTARTAAPKKSSSSLGLGFSKDREGIAEDDEGDDDEDAGPAESDNSFEAKIARFRLYERRLAALVEQVAWHKQCFKAAFEHDQAFATEAVRLAGTEEPQWRSAAVQQWAGSAAASSVGAAYLEAFETVLVAPLAEDTALVAATNESLKARAAVDKEFAHYVGKLAELRLQKADAKKLARNQTKYDETMIRLEMSTETAVGNFTQIEAARERLITVNFVGWQRAQHEHFPDLINAFGNLGRFMIDPDLLGQSCPVQGLSRPSSDADIAGASADDEGATADASSSSSSSSKKAAPAVAKVASASSWRTNVMHRVKYGKAADFRATDDAMESHFATESSFYGMHREALPGAVAAATSFATKVDEAFRSRVDLDEIFLAMCGLPRGGDDVSRVRTDFERFATFDADQLTVAQVEPEVEARLDADIELEELLEITVARVNDEVASVLTNASALFQEPTVLDMLKERPKLVASVNHYVAKMEGLEKAVAEATAHKDKAKQPKLLEAANTKLESNLAKKSVEEEKLAHVTKQLESMFLRTEHQAGEAAAKAAAAAQAIKVELAKHVGHSAAEIAAHKLVSGGGGGSMRASVGGGRGGIRTRRRGKSSANLYAGSSGGSNYDPNGPSRKALLREGKGANGLPLKLAELRFEQAVTLQASCRRLLVAKKYRRQKASAVQIQALRRQFSAARWYFYVRLWLVKHQAMVRRWRVRYQVAKWHKCARLVQRAWQGKRVKDKFKHSIGLVLKVQKVGRGHMARQLRRKQQKAATKLQSGARQKMACLRANRRLNAVVKLQSSGRRQLAKQQRAREHRAATKLQSIARGRTAASSRSRNFRKVITVQSLARRWRAWQLLAKWHGRAAAIQAVWHGRVAKLQLADAKMAASRIAARARGLYVRQGPATRAVTVVRHVRLVWPDATLAGHLAHFQACVQSNRSRHDRGSLEATFGSAAESRLARSLSTSCGDDDTEAEPTSVLNPMAKHENHRRLPSSSTSSSSSLPNQGSSAATSPSSHRQAHSQLLLFDERLLSLMSLTSLQKLVAGRRHLFKRHKAASLIQAMGRYVHQLKAYGQLKTASVVAQALIRRWQAMRHLKRAVKTATLLQQWLRTRRAKRGAWDAAAAQARLIASKARMAREKAEHEAASRVQKWVTRRQILKRFVRAVADYLVKRERNRLASLRGASEMEDGARLVLQAWIRGAVLVRGSSCLAFTRALRATREETMHQAADTSKRTKEKSSAGSHPSSSPWPLAYARGALPPRWRPPPFPLSSSSSSSFGAARSHAPVPPQPRRARPLFGAFAHFRAACVVIQAFARRTAVLRRLYTRGNITVVLTWRQASTKSSAAAAANGGGAGSATKKPLLGAGSSIGGGASKKRLGAHKLSWARGHRGVVRVTGPALRQLGMLGFCKLLALRRQLYAKECAAACVQALWRGFAQQRRYATALRCVIKAQAWVRGQQGITAVKRFQEHAVQSATKAAKRKRRALFRGVARGVAKFLRSARRVRASLVKAAQASAGQVLTRLARHRAGKRQLRQTMVGWSNTKARITKMQNLFREQRAVRALKRQQKAGRVLVTWWKKRYAAQWVRQTVATVIQLAKAQGGGDGGGAGSAFLSGLGQSGTGRGAMRASNAAWQLQRWWRIRVHKRYKIASAVHKRVLKAGLRHQANARKLKEVADKATVDVKELELELRVMRKHTEETSRMASEKANKLMEQQLAALQQLQASQEANANNGSSNGADMAALMGQLDSFKSQIVSEVGAGSPGGGRGGGEDTSRLLMRIEKQADELDTLNETLRSVESAKEEFRREATKSGREVVKLNDALFDVKKRYIEQRGMNAKLMLEIQSLKGNIQVCCRIRPFNDTEVARGDEPAVELITETEVGVYASNAWETYGFDQVWGAQSSQAQIFEQVEALALSVVDGFNACICCYGQTGSGKTFTMTGLPREGKPGISFQTMDKVFEMLNLKQRAARTNAEAQERAEASALERRRKGKSGGAAGVAERPPPPTGSGGSVTSFEWRAEVSMLEIYNEEVRCLLAPPPSKKDIDAKASKLDIKQGSNGLMMVPGLVSQPVEDTNGVLDAFERGNATRSVASTAMNATSSRSHMVLMVDVATRTNGGAEVFGRLYLVDLAGSERVAKSGVTGQAMKEAQGINKSLSALGDVMEALDKGQGHVPFRNSKLTFLLQSALGGSARCMFIFNASPAEGNSDETRCTFKFASRMRNISLGAAKKNVDASGLEGALTKAKAESRAAERELAIVKAELATLQERASKKESSSSSSGPSAAEVAATARRAKEAEADLKAAAQEVSLLRDQLQAAQKQVQQLKAQPPAATSGATPVRRRPSLTSSSSSTSVPRSESPAVTRPISTSVRRPSASRPRAPSPATSAAAAAAVSDDDNSSSSSDSDSDKDSEKGDSGDEAAAAAAAPRPATTTTTTTSSSRLTSSTRPRPASMGGTSSTAVRSGRGAGRGEGSSSSGRGEGSMSRRPPRPASMGGADLKASATSSGYGASSSSKTTDASKPAGHPRPVSMRSTTPTTSSTGRKL